jgi:hypothetical protein
LLLLLFSVICGLAAWYLQTSSLGSLYEVVLFLGGFVSALALPAGLCLGLEMDVKAAGQRETQLGDSISEAQLESGMGSFLSTRPFSSQNFASAILRNAALSSLIAWLIWFALFAACLLTMWLTKQSPSEYMPRDTGLLFIPMTVLGPWIAMANLGTLGLSGRLAKLVFAFVCLFVGYSILMGVVNHFTSPLVSVQLHTAFTTIGSVLIVAATIGAFALAWRQKHLTSKALLGASLTAYILVTAAILLRPTDVHFIFYPLVFIFAALFVLPFASTPLAIAWNRHR